MYNGPRFRPWCRLLAPAVLLVGWLWPAAPAPASPGTPLQQQTGIAWDLLNVRALVVAKLVRWPRGADRAFVVFEEQHVLRGTPPGRRLVFPNPELPPPPPESPPAITADDIRQLEVGGTYLIVVGRGEPPELVRWRRLGGPDDDKMLADELKPYADLDRGLKLDPWATAGGGGTLFEQGCVHAYYGRLAPAAELDALLAKYPELDRLTFDQQLLTHEVLDRTKWEDLRLSPDVLRGVYDTSDRGDEVTRLWGAMVRGQVLRVLAPANDPKDDDRFRQAADSPDPDLRTAAWEALAVRKQPGTLPAIRKAFSAGGQEGMRAARALVHQQGEAGVAEVLDACKRDRALLSPEAGLLSAVREYVGKPHVPALRALDDPTDISLHARILQLLLDAGDEDGIERIRRWGAVGWVKFPPAGDPRLVRHARVWATVAKAQLRQRSGDEATLAADIEILRAANDPDLPDLLAKAADYEHRALPTLRCVQRFAEERHRPLFIGCVVDADPELRAYGWAGLARLGDRAAQARLAEAAWLSPYERTRGEAGWYLVPTFDPAALLAAWNAHDPGTPGTEAKPDADAHGYVAAQLDHLIAARKAGPPAGPGTG